MDALVFEEIERIIKSNDSLVIECENDQERFELTFQWNNNLYIEYTDQEVLYQEETITVDEVIENHSLEDLQESALEFIQDHNAIKYIEISKGKQVLFLRSDFEKMVREIKNLRKRETGLRFGKNRNIFEELDSPQLNNDDTINETKHLRLLRNYLSRDRSILEDIDTRNRSPLVAAIKNMDYPAVLLILNFNPPNINNYYVGRRAHRYTPLMFAAYLNEPMEIIKSFIKHGAETDLKSSEGKKAWEYAKNEKTKEYLKNVKVNTIKIQRAYRSLIKNRKNRLEELTREIPLTPPGAYHKNYPGGAEYLKTAERYSFGKCTTNLYRTIDREIDYLRKIV